MAWVSLLVTAFVFGILAYWVTGSDVAGVITPFVIIIGAIVRQGLNRWNG